MIRSRVKAIVVAGLIVGLAGIAGPVAAAAPANDEPDGAIPLRLDTPLDFDSSEATAAAADPTGCDGSHGTFDGPFFASVWFSYTAKANDRALFLSAPTMQGEPDQHLGITFVFAKTAGGLELVDCTADGNEISWTPTKGTTYLIMEAGLSSAVTGEPDVSDRGGHGTLFLARSASLDHYRWSDQWTYDDCGLPVEAEGTFEGTFRLLDRAGDSTPYYFDNYNAQVVTRNPANGKWFREEAQGMYRDLSITKIAGTVYQFEAFEVGQPYVLTDMNGQKVYFDRGHLRTTFQVDTKGDTDLSNDEYVEDSWALLADNGSHPFFYFDGDWCADIVVPLLGD
jgi:hypothetical protein